MPNVMETEPEERQPARFILLYALAVAGGAVSYVPFLSLLLPVRVAAIAGGETISVLAAIAFFGAIVASLGNIAFGWASDLTGNRVPWIVSGLLLSSSLLLAIPAAETAFDLVVLIAFWQLALNMMLAPLSAWAGDLIPDNQKGLLGGLLAFAPAVGAASGALVTIPGLADASTRFILVALLTIVMVLPVILFGRPKSMPHLTVPSNRTVPNGELSIRNTVSRMWLARLLIQIAEASLFAYLLIWLVSVDDSVTDNDTAKIFTIVLSLAVPTALMVGRWSDRIRRPLLPLTISACTGCFALAIMALADTFNEAVTGYIFFGLSSGVFLALHSAQTLRVLPNPGTRGRDLGFFNLTNTMPSLIMPPLAIALVPLFGFEALFATLAVLAALAAALLGSARKDRRID